MPDPQHASNALHFNQVSVTSTASKIVDFDSARKSVVVVNNDSATNMFIGDATVTAITGNLLPPLGSITFINHIGPVYGITAAATITASYIAESSV